MNHSTPREFSWFDHQPDELVRRLLAEDRRVLLMGAPGIGKSYLAAHVEADAALAARTGHLTTRACGEIASAAAVTRLVPFHFSLRNSDQPDRVYDEIRAACPQVTLP